MAHAGKGRKIKQEMRISHAGEGLGEWGGTAQTCLKQSKLSLLLAFLCFPHGLGRHQGF